MNPRARRARCAAKNSNCDDCHNEDHPNGDSHPHTNVHVVTASVNAEYSEKYCRKTYIALLLPNFFGHRAPTKSRVFFWSVNARTARKHNKCKHSRPREGELGAACALRSV